MSRWQLCIQGVTSATSPVKSACLCSIVFFALPRYLFWCMRSCLAMNKSYAEIIVMRIPRVPAHEPPRLCWTHISCLHLWDAHSEHYARLIFELPFSGHSYSTVSWSFGYATVLLSWTCCSQSALQHCAIGDIRLHVTDIALAESEHSM